MKKCRLVTLPLSFWENVWVYWHWEKKSHKPSALRASEASSPSGIPSSPFQRQRRCRTRGPCVRLQGAGGWTRSALRHTASARWARGSAGVICRRGTGSERHHATRGRVFIPRCLSQGRTNFLPSFGVHPSFSPAPSVLLEMQSRIARSTVRRMRNEGQLFLQVFTPIGDILLHSNNTHTQHRF